MNIKLCSIRNFLINCSNFSTVYSKVSLVVDVIFVLLSKIVALAEKFSELVIVFERATNIDDRSDSGGNVIRENVQKHISHLAFELLGETPADEEQAIQVLHVLNHPLVFDHIVPAAAKLASKQAATLITSEASLSLVMEFQTETLINLAKRELPEADLLTVRLRNTLEETDVLEEGKPKCTSAFERFKASDNDPALLIQFARECLMNFCEHDDADQLMVARRVMIRLSKQSDDPVYWAERFTEQLQSLELASTSGAYLKDFRNECLATLNELGCQLGASE